MRVGFPRNPAKYQTFRIYVLTAMGTVSSKSLEVTLCSPLKVDHVSKDHIASFFMVDE
jgi:hypothetical protein